MKDRVKVLLNGTSPESETSEHAMVTPPQPQAHPNQALQVLTLAQRTAEEHVARAHHQADKIRTDALAAAEQIARDAQAHAHNVRREADKVLADARAASEQVARDSHARTDDARRSAEKIVAEATAQAEQIAAEAGANADHLNLQARQRYDDVVGSLGTKREALQQQIEALEQFDREYRARLTHFMQDQLRALWVDQPHITADLPDEPLLPQIQAGASAPAAQGSIAQGSIAQGSLAQGPLTQGPLTQGPAAQGSPTQGSLGQGSLAQGPAEAAVAGPRHGAEDGEDAVPAQRLSPEEDEHDEEEELSER